MQAGAPDYAERRELRVRPNGAHGASTHTTGILRLTTRHGLCLVWRRFVRHISECAFPAALRPSLSEAAFDPLARVNVIAKVSALRWPMRSLLGTPATSATCGLPTLIPSTNRTSGSKSVELTLPTPMHRGRYGKLSIATQSGRRPWCTRTMSTSGKPCPISRRDWAHHFAGNACGNYSRRIVLGHDTPRSDDGVVADGDPRI